MNFFSLQHHRSRKPRETKENMSLEGAFGWNLTNKDVMQFREFLSLPNAVVVLKHGSQTQISSSSIFKKKVCPMGITYLDKFNMVKLDYGGFL